MRLNNKTIRNYLFYSSIISLLTIPVFYLVVRKVLLHSVDSSLKSQLHEIRGNLDAIHTSDELRAWTKMDKDINLSPTDRAEKDKIISTTHYSVKHREEEPFREMSGTVSVGGQQYKLTVSASLVENEDLLISILMVQIGVLLVLIGGMLWINQKISRRLWQPFYIALRNMQSFELNKQTDLPFKSSTTDEFNELNKAINNLFSRSTQLYQHQKEFTENASHEMQTPLAIFQSKLELLMQTSPLSEEQAGLINALDETNNRLIKLNKSLLLLTRIENNQYQTTETVSIKNLCLKLTRQLSAYAENKNTTIHTRFNEDIGIDVNNTLIEILVGNLLTNAIRYNRDNGEVTVTTESNSLTIGNTGAPTALDPSRIFDRFHKQNGTEDSTGLGLAIVKNICALYNYNINYSFTDDRHFFTVIFRITPESSSTFTANYHHQ
ncbi:sensor histidine kinase [Puia sp. P3]|uniref:PorY family sensor histidine kinase n=1 Tax=Puia sp. P3 TaxID=3423952 RepID=UPI003D66B287